MTPIQKHFQSQRKQTGDFFLDEKIFTCHKSVGQDPPLWYDHGLCKQIRVLS